MEAFLRGFFLFLYIENYLILSSVSSSSKPSSISVSEAGLNFEGSGSGWFFFSYTIISIECR